MVVFYFIFSTYTIRTQLHGKDIISMVSFPQFIYLENIAAFLYTIGHYRN